MKKVLYIFAAVALLFGVASCQKDKDEDPEENITTQQAGVYNPGMKISRIYYQYEDGEKELDQVWRWKDNKLIEIQEGNRRYSYTYQNNRLSKLEVYYDGNLRYTYVYSYEGANFSKIEVHYEGEFKGTFEFDYKNGKISSMYFYHVDSDQFFVDFTWNGDNVSSIYGTASMPVGYSDETFIFGNYDNTYVYDNNNNPFCGGFLFLMNVEKHAFYSSLSKNNVTRDHNGQYEYYYENSYEYNSKGYPVKKIETYCLSSTITHTHTYYYEYLED